MKKKLKGTLSLLLCMIMLFGAVAVGGEGIELPSISDIFGTKATAATSGTCGDNLTWSFDESTGTLEISGTGDMANYSYNNRPWEDSEDRITTVTIGNGVTSIGDYAFYSFDKLAKASIPYGVTKIGNYAFENCGKLSEINLPNSLTVIGSSAFEYCSNIQSIIIPDGVVGIGRSAFERCAGLKSLTIPSSVTSIGNRAFRICDNLSEINVSASNATYSSLDGVLFDKNKTRLIQYPAGKPGTKYNIPNGVISIGDSAFMECLSLTSMSIPVSVTSIGDFAFMRCSGLSNITISNSVTSIGYRAFAYCTTLTDIQIPDSVTSIGNAAFENCTDLANVTIPAGVTTISEYTFSHCSSLTDVTIPDGVTSIGDSAFSGCSSLKSIIIPSSVTTIERAAFERCTGLTSVVIPVGVTNLACFRGCTGLTSIIIPDSVTSIGNLAFEDCTRLTSLTIPKGVTNIGDSAFEGCTGLTSLAIPDSVTSIGNSAFERCTGLTNLTIPDSVTSIGYSAFERCEKLVSVKLPSGITEIKYDTFYGCSSLETIDIPSGVKSIGNKAFLNCKKLVSITIPFGVAEISKGAFNGCSNLTRIEVDKSNENYSSEDGVLYNKSKTELLLYPYAKTDYAYYISDNVTSIDISLWINNSLSEINVDSASTTYSSENGVLLNKNKTELIRYPAGKSGTKYAIPSSVTKIGALAFYNCNNIIDVELPSSISKIEGYAFNHCGKLISIIIPTGVTEISEACFAGCESLVSITIPNGVTSISDYAFVDTNIKNMVIPDSVTTIGDFAFTSSSLEKINIPKGIAKFSRTAFIGCNSLKVIEVDPDNENYCSDEQGALYNKNKTKLVWLPQALPVYYMPDSVKDIATELSGDLYISAINFNAGTEKFVVSSGNTAFSSDEQGALYNKDKTTLIQFPCASPLEKFVMPASVEGYDDVNSFAMNRYRNLKYIEVESGNKHFWNDENGILYVTDGDFSALVKVPDNTPLDFYSIPETVSYVYEYALFYIGNIKRIHCSSSDLSYNVMCSVPGDCFYGPIEKLVDPIAQIDGEFVYTYPFGSRTVCSEDEFLDPENLDYLCKTSGYRFELCDGNHDVHKHTPKTVTVPASCTVDGMEYEVCTECGETIGTPTVIKAKGHTEVKDIAVKPTCTATGLTEGAHCSVCNTIIKKQEVIPATGHTEVKDIAVKPTCTATGLTEGAHCSVCNTIIKKQEVIPATGHTSGDWVVVTEPTADADGKRVKKCTVCGTILSEEILPKLTVAVDEKTGIELDYSGGDYSGKVELSVEETFDGAAFNLVNTQFNVSQSFIYDIKMTVDGVETQPAGTVKVRIPLPEGFDPARTFVYHVDTETGKVVKMAATYKDGYLEFETDHFSYYAVVEEAKPCKLTINTPSTTTVSYGFTLNLHANVTDLPEGARVVWSMDGSGFELIPSADGMTCGVKSVSKGSATITAKVVDKNGNAVKDANGNEITASQQLTSKAGFFQKLVAFFKKLFGSNMVIPSSLNKLIK